MKRMQLDPVNSEGLKRMQLLCFGPKIRPSYRNAYEKTPQNPRFCFALMNSDMFYSTSTTLSIRVQRRNHRSNCCLICFPLLVCLLLGGVQLIVAIAYASSAAHRPRVDCGGCTASTTSSSSADTVVGGPVCPIQCPLPTAPKWPPVLQLPPAPEDMEEIGSSTSTDDLTGASTARPNPPAATFLVTGTNRSFAEGMHIFSKMLVQVWIFFLSRDFRFLEQVS